MCNEGQYLNDWNFFSFDRLVFPPEVHLQGLVGEHQQQLFVHGGAGKMRAGSLQVRRVELWIVAPVGIVDTDLLVEETLNVIRVLDRLAVAAELGSVEAVRLFEHIANHR